MTLTIELSPSEEARLAVAARRAGLEPAALVKQLVAAHLPATAAEPPDPTTHVRALLARWQAEDHTPAPPPVAARPGETPTEALFRQWAAEDAGMTDEERRAEDRLWKEFEAGINRTRRALGMRRLSG